MSVFKTVFRPVLTFGSESWVLSDRLKSKIQAMEMKYLRKVKEVTRKDRIRNVVIREELKVNSVLDVIEQRELAWFGHLIKMKNDRPVKVVWEARTSTKRGRGRPRETWDKTIEKILGKRGKTMMEARELARNKREWRKFVYS